MRRFGKPEKQIDFLLTLMRKDINHYETQAEAVDQWIHSAILSLKQSDTSLFEGLHDEYKQKAFMQRQVLLDLQTSLRMYLDMRNQDQYLNFQCNDYPDW